MQKTTLIIGAGPAGLTAALELCRRSNIRPILFEASDRIGGISCTIRYKGNRIDIGGHRFFSKSDRVMNWWTDLMPIASHNAETAVQLRYHNESRAIAIAPSRGPVPPRQTQPSDPDCVMLVRARRSRIYFNRTFFDYPLSLSPKTLKRLGILRSISIGLSYMKARLLPRKREETLEDFLINRFGETLYLTFFKSYTEKVWGVPCEDISAAWGAQRIKGLSLRKAVVHFLKGVFSKKQSASPETTPDVKQKNSETSLIEHFLYPKFGPGQLWEHAASQIQQLGGEIRMGWRVTGINVEERADGTPRVASIEASSPDGSLHTIAGDYFFSTMPIRELLRVIHHTIPREI